MLVIQFFASTECSVDAAMVIHLQVRILPMSAEFNSWPVIGNKAAGPGWPVVHIERDRFAIRGKRQTTPHAAAEMHSEALSLRRTEVRETVQVGGGIDSAASS